MMFVGVYSLQSTDCDDKFMFYDIIISVVIGILLQSTARYEQVEQHRPRFVLGWVTVLVFQFLLIVLPMRLLSEVPWRCSCGDSMNFKVLFSIFNFFLTINNSFNTLIKKNNDK